MGRKHQCLYAYVLMLFPRQSILSCSCLQVGEIHVQVMNVNTSTEERVVYGTEMECYVGDGTSKMKLVLCDSQVKVLKPGWQIVLHYQPVHMLAVYTVHDLHQSHSHVNVPASIAAIHAEEQQQHLLTITDHITGVKLDERR